MVLHQNTLMTAGVQWLERTLDDRFVFLLAITEFACGEIFKSDSSLFIAQIVGSLSQRHS